MNDDTMKNLNAILAGKYEELSDEEVGAAVKLGVDLGKLRPVRAEGAGPDEVLVTYMNMTMKNLNTILTGETHDIPSEEMIEALGLGVDLGKVTFTVGYTGPGMKRISWGEIIR